MFPKMLNGVGAPPWRQVPVTETPGGLRRPEQRALRPSPLEYTLTRL